MNPAQVRCGRVHRVDMHSSVLILFLIASMVASAADLPSTTFAVEAGGKPVPVIRYEDIDVAHFPFAGSGPMPVRITRLDGVSVGEHRIRPERLGYRGQATGAELKFDLDRPQTLFVNVDRLRKLLILAERPGAGPPNGPAVVNAITVGADPTGNSDSTAALEKAIQDLPAGGTLYLPPGCYRSGSLELKSDMTLYLEFGATLKGSSDPEAHRMQNSYLYFLRGQDLHNVRIAGPGIIDANGDAVRTAWQKKLNRTKVAGRALLLMRVRGLELRDVTVRDSYSWNVHLVECDKVVCDNMKVLSNMTHSNGDGLDIDGCVDVRVENSLFYAEDDAISPKSSWSHRTPERYLVRNCVLWSQNATGIRLGDEADSPEFRDMTFEGIDILRANTMLRIYNYDGADLHGIVFRDLWLEEYSMEVQGKGYEETARTKSADDGVTSLLHVYVKKRNDRSKLGVVRDVTLERIHSARLMKSRLTDTPRTDGKTSIQNITFRDCDEMGRVLRTLEEMRVKCGSGSDGVRVE